MNTSFKTDLKRWNINMPHLLNGRMSKSHRLTAYLSDMNIPYSPPNMHRSSGDMILILKVIHT